MTGAPLAQRCWNHEAREAVCRCPACGRSFCRECVTEHDARLLCASCLNALTRGQSKQRSGLRRLAAPAMAIAGLVFASLVFFGAGEGLLLITARMEQTSWQGR
jgi:hypothetical protein